MAAYADWKYVLIVPEPIYNLDTDPLMINPNT
jgi:hypothetical protein